MTRSRCFEANVEFYPDDSNAHDSLGEAYPRPAGRTRPSPATRSRSSSTRRTTNAVKMLEQLGVHP